MEPQVITFSQHELETLGRRFQSQNQVTPFNEDLTFSASIASLGIYREIGTVNDELARFIFDTKTQLPVPLNSLKAHLINWKGLIGVQVFCAVSQSLELRSKGFYDMVHPVLSSNSDGTLHSLFIFPHIVNKIANNEGIVNCT